MSSHIIEPYAQEYLATKRDNSHGERLEDAKKNLADAMRVVGRGTHDTDDNGTLVTIEHTKIYAGRQPNKDQEVKEWCAKKGIQNFHNEFQEYLDVHRYLPGHLFKVVDKIEVRERAVPARRATDAQPPSPS